MATLLEVLSRAGTGTKEKIDGLTAVMERIATALKVQGRQLATWEQRLAAQQSVTARLSQQIETLTVLLEA